VAETGDKAGVRKAWLAIDVYDVARFHVAMYKAVPVQVGEGAFAGGTEGEGLGDGEAFAGVQLTLQGAWLVGFGVDFITARAGVGEFHDVVK